MELLIVFKGRGRRLTLKAILLAKVEIETLQLLIQLSVTLDTFTWLAEAQS